MQVAQTAFAASCQQDFFTIVSEIGDDLATVAVGDYRADRHVQHDIVRTLAVAI